MKKILLALLFFICAAIDGTWTAVIWTGAILYGADAGAVLTLTLFSAFGTVVCAGGGIATLMERKKEDKK